MYILPILFPPILKSFFTAEIDVNFVSQGAASHSAAPAEASTIRSHHHVLKGKSSNLFMSYI